jgi:hypothetical protein
MVAARKVKRFKTLHEELEGGDIAAIERAILAKSRRQDLDGHESDSDIEIQSRASRQASSVPSNDDMAEEENYEQFHDFEEPVQSKAQSSAFSRDEQGSLSTSGIRKRVAETDEAVRGRQPRRGPPRIPSASPEQSWEDDCRPFIPRKRTLSSDEEQEDRNDDHRQYSPRNQALLRDEEGDDDEDDDEDDVEDDDEDDVNMADRQPEPSPPRKKAIAHPPSARAKNRDSLAKSEVRPVETEVRNENVDSRQRARREPKQMTVSPQQSAREDHRESVPRTQARRSDQDQEARNIKSSHYQQSTPRKEPVSDRQFAPDDRHQSVPRTQARRSDQDQEARNIKSSHYQQSTPRKEPVSDRQFAPDDRHQSVPRIQARRSDQDQEARNIKSTHYQQSTPRKEPVSYRQFAPDDRHQSVPRTQAQPRQKGHAQPVDKEKRDPTMGNRQGQRGPSTHRPVMPQLLHRALPRCPSAHREPHCLHQGRHGDETASD